MKAIVIIISMFFFCLVGTFVPAAEKALVGETAWIGVGGVPFSYLARIDTGARVTSINAIDVEVVGGSEIVEENVGKTVSFKTINGDGKFELVTAIITKVSTVKNSQGIEKRYVIELPLSWKHVEKKVEVNLRDRSKMSYKLLIGRNWLSGDFLVDVDMKAEEKGVE